MTSSLLLRAFARHRHGRVSRVRYSRGSSAQTATEDTTNTTPFLTAAAGLLSLVGFAAHGANPTTCDNDTSPFDASSSDPIAGTGPIDVEPMSGDIMAKLDIQAWLKEQKVSADCYNANELIEKFQDEMRKGLRGEESSLAMIPAYVGIDKEVPKKKSVAVIDAGGPTYAFVRHTLMRKARFN